jgi:TPR repeat protein
VTRRTRPIRALALALLLAGAHAHAAGATARPAIPDPQAAWTKLLAEAEFDRVQALYRLVDTVEGGDTEVDLPACREQRAALDAALAEIPVGLALWYAAYRCAELDGRTEDAEHYLEGTSVLVKHAMGQVSEDMFAPPIRVLSHADVRALARAGSFDVPYALYEPSDVPRHLIIEQAVRSGDGRVRHLRYDFLDSYVRLSRKRPEAEYPAFRRELADELIRNGAAGGGRMALDVSATRGLRDLPTVQARIDRLRGAAANGGMQSTWSWIALCANDAGKIPGCAEGLVDALLPRAEKREPLPMVLLALAYAEGLGVPRDAKASLRLLDAAQSRWSEAVTSYLRYHRALHEEPLPAELAERLQRVADAGDVVARRMMLERKLRASPGGRISDADLAPLLEIDRAGKGRVAAHIGWALWQGQRRDESVPWLAKGAAEGQAAAQDLYAHALNEGFQVARDEAGAERWWREAAAGGDTDAMQTLGQRAYGRGEHRAAQEWFSSAATFGSEEGAWRLAGLLETAHPDLPADLKRAVSIYRELDEKFDYVPARQALSRLHMEGTGVEKDPAKARALLQVDAEKGDTDSQLLLAYGLAHGKFGAADEAEGERWYRKALEQGGAQAADAYAYWLYMGRGTEPARKQAFELWRGIATGEDNSGWNNFAWVLCTTRHAADRNPGEGLALVKKIGDADDLPPYVLDTLAACHAAAGEFAQAEALQRKVIDALVAMDAEDASLPGMRARLALYAARKPYVEDKAGEP